MTTRHLATHALAALLCAGTATLAGAQTILAEDFEDGVLDPRISVATVGTFGSASGIKSFTGFGSDKAFGYGRSTCRVNCFDGSVTNFTITFAQPTFVSSVSFKEMELFSNWGSGGNVLADGVLVSPDRISFGRLPYNDFQADTTFRVYSLQIDRTVTQLVLQVWDITDLSEIYIDDLIVNSASAVPEPSAAWLLALGAPALWLAARRRQRGG
jgi:hypothetical protein